MESPEPQPPPATALSILQPVLTRYTVVPKPNKTIGWHGKPFIRTRLLRKWLRSDYEGDHYKAGCSNADILLNKTYEDSALKVTLEELMHDERSCVLTMCILIELGRGRELDKFNYQGIRDHKLPMPLAQLKECLGRDTDLSNYVQLAEDFDSKQWTYFPYELYYDMREDMLPQRIVPICMRQQIKEGGTAHVHEIAVPADCISDELKSLVCASEIDASAEGFGKCFYFALKIYHDQYSLFKAERDAYAQLRNQKHIVRCLGAFSLSEPGDTTSKHHLLLEYGQYDLAENFRCGPPTLLRHINEFWSDLFAIADAVKGIHHIERHQVGEVVKYEGWHADIKPNNILRVHGKYKLADPGFAKIVKRLSSETKDERGVRLLGRTPTYGAPEAHDPDARIKLPAALDMWSLGCVFSEAATWVVLGHAGCVAYRNWRLEATKKAWLAPSTQNISPGQGDFFHDGVTVLGAVTQWHKMLRAHVKLTDRVTVEILDLVDNSLLIREPARRIQAYKLCNELQALERKIKAEIEASAPSPIAKFIADAIDEERSLMISGSETILQPSIAERKKSKSALSTLRPSNVDGQTHRIARSVVVDARVYGPSHGTSGSSHLGSEDPFLTNTARRSDQSGLSRVSTTHNNLVEPARQVTTPTKIPHASQDIFDAHLEAQSRRRGTKVWGWGKVAEKARKKGDKVLLRHFTDRDIVFMVDNAVSMNEHWSKATFTLQELAKKAQHIDEDGMDLLFTNGSECEMGAKNNAAELFVQKMRSDEVRPHAQVPTNMASALGDQLHHWLEKFKSDRHNHRKTRNKTIIVLTDGKWEGMRRNEAGVDQTIVKFSKALEKFTDNLPGRPFSIQFVSFGNDEDALYRLKRLDNDLCGDGVPDIVDTEPFYGNIYKMLLGSFVDAYDDSDDEEPGRKTTSPRHTGDMTSPMSPRSSRSTTSPTSTFTDSGGNMAALR